MSRERPFPASMSVRAARDAYLVENGFTLEAYDARWTEASFFGVPFVVPNTKRHRFAIMLHDLHHVATGYGTDLVGEGEISAWELKSVRALGAYVGGIVTLGATAGTMLAPTRVRAAWRAGKTHGTLFERVATEAEYEALLECSVGELRAMLGVPAEGIADRPPRLHSRAPR